MALLSLEQVEFKIKSEAGLMKKKYPRQYHAQIEQTFPRLSSLYDDTKTGRSSMPPMNCDSACLSSKPQTK